MMAAIRLEIGLPTFIALGVAVVVCAVLFRPVRQRKMEPETKPKPGPDHEPSLDRSMRSTSGPGSAADVNPREASTPDSTGTHSGAGVDSAAKASPDSEAGTEAHSDAGTEAPPQRDRAGFRHDERPDPPAEEDVVGRYLVLRVTNPMQPVSSTLYPMLRGDAEPSLWPGEQLVRREEEVGDLGRKLEDERKRTGSKARVVFTNRRLIAWSRDRPPGAQGWQHSPDNPARTFLLPGTRLMAHVLWEWVAEIRVSSSTEQGRTVEIVMDASERGYRTASLLLTFEHSTEAAAQRARVFADDVNSWLNKNGVESRRDGENYIMSRHTPVGLVSWWDRE